LRLAVLSLDSDALSPHYRRRPGNARAATHFPPHGAADIIRLETTRYSMIQLQAKAYLKLLPSKKPPKIGPNS